MLDPVLVAGHQAATNPPVVGVLPALVEQVRVRVQALDDLVAIEDFSSSQIDIPRTRMSAAITRWLIAGHSSASQPCSVMSGQIPVAIWWSTAWMHPDLDLVATHDLHRDVDQTLGMR